MQESSARLSLGRALLWVAGGAVAAQIAGGLTASLMRALGTRDGLTAEQLEHAPRVVVPALVVSSLTLFAVVLFATRVEGIPTARALGLRRPPVQGALLTVIGTLALGPSAEAMMRLAAAIAPEATLGVVPMLSAVVSATPSLLVWPVFALLPGIAEELAFRGLVQRAARPRWLAIVVSALSFALFHVDLHHVAGVLPLGLFLAWAAARCGTTVTIIAHVVNNSVAIALVHAGQDPSEPVPSGVLAASLVVVGLVVLGLSRPSFSSPR